MTLARRVGLSVPLASILRKWQDLYLVERYDRRPLPDGSLERVHQEDFCQALGIAPDQKYEQEGGPGISDCFRVVREHSVTPVVDVRALLHWVVFNYLTGNADAHGKNISLLLTEAGPVLAPFYDLMCTAVYPDLTPRLAMGIGGEDRPDWVIGRSWERFGEDVGIQFKLVRRTLEDMKDQVYGEAAALAAQVRGEYGDIDVIDRIVDVIEARKRKIELAFAALDQGS
jgi:serine/threonine-protein kinase HipA